MRTKIENWKRGSTLAVAVWLLIASAWPGRAACVGDVRAVSVGVSSKGPVWLEVKMVRAYEGEDAVEPLILRADAQTPVVSVGTLPAGSATNLARFLDAASRAGWTRVEPGSTGGYALPAAGLDTAILIFAEFKVSDGFPGGLWWASYVPPESKGLRESAFRLSTPKGIKVATRTGGEWNDLIEADDGNERREWRMANPAAAGIYVVAGAPTTWEAVGRGMAGLLTWMKPGAKDDVLPGELAQLDQIEGDSKRLDKALELISALAKKAPSAGLRALPVRDTIQEGAGNCKDLSLLFIRAAQSVGLAPLVVYRAGGLKDLDGSLPCPHVFDHVLVAVVVAESMCFFDPYKGIQWVEEDLKMDGDVMVSKNLLIVRIE